jgi:hypothetical protein
MTVNEVSLWSEILGVAGGAFALLLFGILLAIPHRVGILPGSRGHRNRKDEENEIIAPDGYIDDYNNHVIEEAGGALPIIIRVALPGIILWWLLYLIFNWVQ